MQLPPSWQRVMGEELDEPYFRKLREFLAQERENHIVYPPAAEVFNAFELTAYEDVKVLLLGQDPYPGEGFAHGLCFSVKPGVRIPQSLRNIYRELNFDLGCAIPAHGDLRAWARQGVLMLNAVLTVRAGKANSHKNKGWERLTDAVIARVSEHEKPVVFLLWGGFAQKKRALINESRHVVVAGVHPSPLSAHNGFFGSRPFSAVNRALARVGRTPIDWQVPIAG